MRHYLKSAVQNLDCEIAQLTEIRNKLMDGAGAPVIGVQIFAPPSAVPGAGDQVSGGKLVQTLGPAFAKASARQARLGTDSKVRGPKAKVEKQKRGGRVGNKIRNPKSEIRTGNAALPPMSEGMLAAARTLAEPFGTEGLQAETNCTKKAAGNAITRWLTNGFIKRVERGKYRRLAKFPEGEARTGVSVKTPEAVKETRPVGETPAARLAEPAVPTAKPKLAAVTDAPLQSEEKLTPYSEKGIAVGKSLKTVFTMDELAALLPQGKQSAYYFVSQWRARSWITKEDFDVYRKAATFGQ